MTPALAATLLEDASETPAAVFVVVPVASDESPDVSVCGVRIALAIFGSMRCFQLVLGLRRGLRGEPRVEDVLRLQPVRRRRGGGRQCRALQVRLHEDPGGLVP